MQLPAGVELQRVEARLARAGKAEVRRTQQQHARAVGHWPTEAWLARTLRVGARQPQQRQRPAAWRSSRPHGARTPPRHLEDVKHYF
eukprot:scaffold33702_cov112-Isochrysis_galbana.AAC.3